MANPRIADNVHKLKGTLQPCRHGSDDAEKAQFKAAIPPMPAFCKKDKAAAKEWERITKIMHAQRILTLADLTTLAAYCKLAGQLLETGELYASQHSQLRGYIGELGLSPASRHKIKPIQKEKSDSDPWSEF